MKRFTIKETAPCVQVWTYEVEAETEEDAIKQVIDGVAGQNYRPNIPQGKDV